MDEVTWHNTGVDLGSVHYILEITIPNQFRSNTIIHKWTDSDGFSKGRLTAAQDITEIETWTAELRDAFRSATKTIKTDQDIIIMDSHLALLIEDKQTISYERGRLAHLTHTITQQQEKGAVVRSLEAKYLPDTSTETHPPYGGLPNTWLHRDITISEVGIALHELHTHSAAAPDVVTNKMLRYLDDASIEALTHYFNECWHSGKLPRQGKTTKTILIPKPGKLLDIGNLRPISFTSCMGKVLENVVPNRWQEYLEMEGL
ncbi:uncharacterized protein LOC142591408 [Dermacentor variabilis]|uniref:uncharacterized protein LOC142591408 n=1 Tax=Dermacentor variabilis TaxID=34621 RepID=UPI003F5C83B2